MSSVILNTLFISQVTDRLFHSPELLALLKLSQKMKHFSQEMVAITNVWFTPLFILWALDQHKNVWRTFDINFGQHYWLNVIFGWTAFGNNNWNQSLPITIIPSNILCEQLFFYRSNSHKANKLVFSKIVILKKMQWFSGISVVPIISVHFMNAY